MRSEIIGRFAFNGIIYLRFDRLDVTGSRLVLVESHCERIGES